MGRAIVVGLGLSGQAALGYLRRCGWEVVGHDDRLSPIEMPSFSKDDLLVLSPGVMLDHPFALAARAGGAEVIGEIELGLRGLNGPAIGVTGTNGKTTSVLLITHVLNESGIEARALGNVGHPLCDHVDRMGACVAVIELSSFQLLGAKRAALDAALLLNISPDHLDVHGSFEAYRAAKWRIRSLVKDGGVFVGDEISSIGYTSCEVACRHFGVTHEQFERAAQSFKPPPHRMRSLGEREGVLYINDSKGTNPAATAMALGRFERGVHLLAGGQAKGASFEVWRDLLPTRVERLYLFGEAADQIEREVGDLVEVGHFPSMQEAVDAARRSAKRGDVVLLSPGCASFDQFSSYAERGEQFEEMVGVK